MPGSGIDAGVHAGVPHDQRAGDACFHCKGTDLAAITESEAREAAPRGFTIQAVHWLPDMSGDGNGLGAVADIPAHRLVGVTQIWLWEFEEPWNWPTLEDTRRMIGELRSRPDAYEPEVRQAIRECEGYIAEEGTHLHRVPPPDC